MRMVKFGNKFLLYFSAGIFFFLSIISFLFTQRCGKEELGEILNGAPVYQIRSPLFLQIIGVFALLCIIWTAGRLVRNKVIRKNHIFGLQILTSVFAGLTAAAVLAGGLRTPIDDQVQAYSAAALFNQGNYLNLSKGGYLNLYPHQLGYVAYLQIIFKIFGNENFRAVQMINCIWIASTVFLCCLCINELTDNLVIRLAGSILILPLLPLYLLGSWVYGDVPCFLFLFLFCFLLLRFCRNLKKSYMIGMTAAMTAGLFFRKNSLILILAAIIVLFLLWWETKKKILILSIFMLAAIPLATVKGLEAYYHNVSGYEIDGGIPSVMWIAMGMQEGASKPGWFNNYCVPVYYETGCDREAASKAAAYEIGNRIDYLKKNPVYFFSFYKRKICTQWNDPFYNTNALISVDKGISPKGMTSWLLQHEDVCLSFLSFWQFALYFGALVYSLQMGKKRTVYENIFLVIFAGGFLFSILWEANSRYIFPYVLLLIPISAQGWYRICEIPDKALKIIHGS